LESPGSSWPDLIEWIEFSQRFFPLDERLPCQRDVNRDGETNICDATHLFMIAVGPAPLDLTRSGSAEDLDLDCNSPCQI
jgi:hypothetical protein